MSYGFHTTQPDYSTKKETQDLSLVLYLFSKLYCSHYHDIAEDSVPCVPHLGGCNARQDFHFPEEIANHTDHLMKNVHYAHCLCWYRRIKFYSTHCLKSFNREHTTWCHIVCIYLGNVLDKKVMCFIFNESVIRLKTFFYQYSNPRPWYKVIKP